MKTAFAALLLLFAHYLGVAFSLFSMDPNPYSTQTGELVCKASPRYLGMGGAGLALADSVSVHGGNPASYAFLDYTLITVSYTPQITTLSDASSRSSHFTDDYPNTELDLPLGRFGVIYGGYHSDRVLSYDVTYRDEQGFERHRFGQGGTYIVTGGYGRSLGKRAAVGLSMGGVFGKIKTGDFILARPSPDAYLEPSRLQRNRFEGYLVEAGGLTRFNKFSVGLSLSLPVGPQTIFQEHQIIQNYTVSDSVVSVQERAIDEGFLPKTVSLGVACSPMTRLKIASDGLFALWDQKKRSMEYRLSLGAEMSLTERQSDNYFLNIPLRIGAYFYSPGYSNPVREEALTFGFSLPTASHYGLIHFSLEGGRRIYTDDPSLLKETFARFSIQLVHKARWGRLRRESTQDKMPDSLE